MVLLLAAMAYAMATTVAQQTPTVDEPVYVTSAVVYLRQHRVSFNPEHPPLGKLVMAAGLAFAHPRLDRSYAPPANQSYGTTQRLIARHLLYESGNDPDRLTRAARVPVLVLTLLFGLVVFGFARDLAGNAGGVLALTLFAASPDVITHGSLATLDVPAAGFLLTSVWLLWRARERPGRYLPWAAVALGAALATRANTLIAVPVLVILVLVRHRWRWALGFAAIAVAVVWAAYLAVDPGLHWTAPDAVPVLHGVKRVAVDLLPFPPAYRDGVRLQFAIDARGARTFLFGRVSGPVWYYLPAAMLVKTPLGLLALWVAAAVTLLVKHRVTAAYLLITPVLVAGSVAVGNRDYGTRYAIVVPMFGAVAAAVLVTLRWRWAHAATAATAAFAVISTARVFPYFLPYSNEAFGGPAETYRRLHDSNVDWGQDLGRLAVKLRERYPGETVWLVYKGSGVPAYYGIDGRNPLRAPPDQVHGLLVVSDTVIDLADPPLRRLMSTATPIDQAGYSITIFRR